MEDAAGYDVVGEITADAKITYCGETVALDALLDLYEGKLSRDWVFRIGCGNFARGGGVKAVKDLRFDRLEFMRCE